MSLTWLPLAVLLPVFPASLIFSAIARRWSSPWVLAGIMLVWSQGAMALLGASSGSPPAWIEILALLTAVLYAYRAIVVNDLTLWCTYLFISTLALFWLYPASERGWAEAHATMLLSVLPLLVLVVLGASVAARLGSTYLGLAGGVMHVYPRVTVLLVLLVIAAMATPPFPLFFVLVELIGQAAPGGAVLALSTWFLWGWAAVQLLQRLVATAPGRAEAVDLVGWRRGDLPRAATWVYGTVLAGMGLAGVMRALEMVGGI